MSNHYYLLVETPDANLSAGMHQLNGVYTKLTNRAHGRVVAPGWTPGADWLATDKLLAYFAPDQQSVGRVLDRERAQQRYVNHVREGIGLPSVWEDLSGQVYLGDGEIRHQNERYGRTKPARRT